MLKSFPVDIARKTNANADEREEGEVKFHELVWSLDENSNNSHLGDRGLQELWNESRGLPGAAAAHGSEVHREQGGGG